MTINSENRFNEVGFLSVYNEPTKQHITAIYSINFYNDEGYARASMAYWDGWRSRLPETSNILQNIPKEQRFSEIKQDFLDYFRTSLKNMSGNNVEKFKSTEDYPKIVVKKRWE